MIRMKTRVSMAAVGCAVALVLSACVETDPASVSAAPATSARAGYSSAEQKLFALPVTQYYGALRVARVVATKCARFDFNSRRDLQINEDRNKEGRGSFAAIGQRKAIQAEMAATQARVFGAYGVDPATSDLCLVGDGEMAKSSAVSAVLVAK